MNKTDATLKKDVEAELVWDPAVRSTSIAVAVRDGVVTVSGHIDTYAEKRAIEKALQRVGGVRATALHLDVQLLPEHRRSDAELGDAVEQALRWNTLTPVDRIRVTVDKGWVTLEGEVEWEYQRRAAEAAVRPLMGVVAISNELTIAPKVSPEHLQTRIADALRRPVEREIDRMEIKVDGGKVTLRGTVHSWHERAAAQGVAWSAPGVRAVVNELKVG